MKKISVILLGIALCMSACSKKNNIDPNSVVINGTAYPTVTINGQTWTTQNYRGPGGGEIVATGSDAEINGNYYNAFNITLPKGWRIPTAADCNNLISNYSEAKDEYGNDEVNMVYSETLRSVNGWTISSGNNGTGFNAYPAGDISNNHKVEEKGNQAEYLTTTYQGSYISTLNISCYDQENNEGDVFYSGFDYFNYGGSNTAAHDIYFSVRFVKDN